MIVYVLYNIDREKIYIGKTSDLSTRLKRHNKESSSKSSSYTSKNSGRWIVVYQEESISNTETTERERWLKSGIGREFIHKHLFEWIHRSMVDPPQADS